MKNVNMFQMGLAFVLVPLFAIAAMFVLQVSLNAIKYPHANYIYKSINDNEKTVAENATCFQRYGEMPACILADGTYVIVSQYKRIQ